MTSEEIRAAVFESDSEEEPFAASDDEEYIPQVSGINAEESDAEQDLIVENEEESSDDEYDANDESEQPQIDTLHAKDGTEWRSVPLPASQTRARNILRQTGGASGSSASFTIKQTFQSLINTEMTTIILRETNRKGKNVTDAYNRKIEIDYPDPLHRPKPKSFKPFDSVELDAFFGILIACGVHRSNKEHTNELWANDGLPLIKASMSRDRFKLLLRFIRFDNEYTRAERIGLDKAAPIRDIWLMLNQNLAQGYKPHESLTVDEQLFPFRGRTKFTQYIPSKPSKYGIKVFWVCDSTNAYPLKGQIYTGKPSDAERQKNVGERTVLDLVAKYKNSGRNVTCDNFFTTLQLGETLNSWKMSLVGTVRKNKKFLPSSMQANNKRDVHSTNFAFNSIATLCSYVPKRNKAVVLLSTMHMTGEIDNSMNNKPEIIKYYNKTKGAVDTMDKMLGEYTTKRTTKRWPLAFFFNIIDVAALAGYIIYMDHNQNVKSTDKRRKFLKDLAYQLCLPAVNRRSEGPFRKNSTKSAIEMVLERRIAPTQSLASTSSQPHGSRGPSPVVGRCCLCHSLNKTRRKTRKRCHKCGNPVCDEHTITTTTCIECNLLA